MAEARIEIRIGTLAFIGEGSEGWLAQQVDKVLARLAELETEADEALNPARDSSDGGQADSQVALPAKNGQTLAAFLKDKKATDNQARKLAAAALWLQDEQGMDRVATRDVTGALDEHKQGKLANASQCLTNNVKKGWAVGDGKAFYISEEGRAELDK